MAKRVQELVAEEAKLRIHVAQGLPLTTDKPQVIRHPPKLNFLLTLPQTIFIVLFIANDDNFDHQNLPKPHVKEQTKPLNIKLHTEQRAARRAGFNNLVSLNILSEIKSSSLYSLKLNHLLSL